MTTSNKTPDDLLDPLLRKVDHRPLRDVARLVVLLIFHVPLAIILKNACEISVAHKDG